MVEEQEITEQENVKEPKFRLNIKLGAKGVACGEYTVRGDTLEEVKANLLAVRQLFKAELAELKI